MTIIGRWRSASSARRQTERTRRTETIPPAHAAHPSLEVSGARRDRPTSCRMSTRTRTSAETLSPTASPTITRCGPGSASTAPETPLRLTPESCPLRHQWSEPPDPRALLLEREVTALLPARREVATSSNRPPAAPLPRRRRRSAPRPSAQASCSTPGEYLSKGRCSARDRGGGDPARYSSGRRTKRAIE